MIAVLRDWRSSAMSRAALAVTLISAGAVLLLRFPPDRYHFYPSCPIATYLHLQCPGCGSTRALAALLRGHVTEALRLNVVTTVLFPVGIFFLGRHLWSQRHGERLTMPHPPPYAVYTLLAVAAVFTVARNLAT